MTDMLVKLYDLPPLEPALERVRAIGVDIRRALPCCAHPPTCFLAVSGRGLAGFGCYDATGLGMFGPIGVDETLRGGGVGTALMLACLHAMLARGYFYAVIGSVGPKEFYARTVGAVEIADSTPGPYRGMLRDRDYWPS